MSRIAFYAPLKSPRHPTASGDRQVARNLMAALEKALDRPVWLASEFRSFEPRGDAAAQTRLQAEATAEVDRISGLTDIALWVTYHNYYKAPDLIGPAVAAHLGVPYVLIEATRAKSRLSGPWAGFAHAAEAASDAARVIFHFTANDLIALSRDRVAGQEIVELPPFLDRDSLPAPSTSEGAMLSVGMMRPGDKLASYTLVAQALAHVTAPDWRLEIAGDGPARLEVEALFAPFGARVRFLDAVDRDALAEIYGQGSLLIWPGVNEAFGMVYLEAQAAGLPVVAQDRPGVRDVLGPDPFPAPEDGPEALARQIDRLLGDAVLRHQLGDAARARIAARHLMPAAAGILRGALLPLVAARSDQGTKARLPGGSAGQRSEHHNTRNTRPNRGTGP